MDPIRNGSLQDSCLDRTTNFDVRFQNLKRIKDRFHKTFAYVRIDPATFT